MGINTELKINSNATIKYPAICHYIDNPQLVLLMTAPGRGTVLKSIAYDAGFISSNWTMEGLVPLDKGDSVILSNE